MIHSKDKTSDFIPELAHSVMLPLFARRARSSNKCEELSTVIGIMVLELIRKRAPKAEVAIDNV